VFGYNEERAIVHAIRGVFHSSGHVFCARAATSDRQWVDVQMRQQLLRLLQMCCEVQTADTSTASNDASNQLLEYTRLHLQEETDYLSKHVLPKLRNNKAVRYSYSAWQSMAADRRDELFGKFLQDFGRRQQLAAVTATDSSLMVLNTTKVARKLGQRKRPQSSCTNTAK